MPGAPGEWTLEALWLPTGAQNRGYRLERGTPELKVYAPATYQIRVQGVVGESWNDFYAGMTIDVDYEAGPQPVTTLTGQLQDQAALIGALTLLYDRCLPILSVEHLPDQ